MPADRPKWRVAGYSTHKNNKFLPAFIMSFTECTQQDSTASRCACRPFRLPERKREILGGATPGVENFGLPIRVQWHQAATLEKLHDNFIEPGGILEVTGMTGVGKNFVYGTWNQRRGFLAAGEGIIVLTVDY